MPIFYIDGESRGNEQNSLPRNARIAIAYADSSDTIEPGKFRIYWQPIGDRTNNEAEYYALLKALALITERWADKATGRIQGGIGEILIRSDSQLVVNQVNGEWRVEDSKLIELSEEARDSSKKLGRVKLEWVPREENYAGLWLEGKLKPLSIERIRG
ncbi:ribonuclease HI family protein [Candidatus Bathyarchaeota archaeon]|nr:MAG: ribonuclease HI family protein [Candidatus Bathyarchaeota archaeon]